MLIFSAIKYLRIFSIVTSSIAAPSIVTGSIMLPITLIKTQVFTMEKSNFKEDVIPEPTKTKTITFSISIGQGNVGKISNVSFNPKPTIPDNNFVNEFIKEVEKTTTKWSYNKLIDHTYQEIIKFSMNIKNAEKGMDSNGEYYNFKGFPDLGEKFPFPPENELSLARIKELKLEIEAFLENSKLSPSEQEKVQGEIYLMEKQIETLNNIIEYNSSLKNSCDAIESNNIVWITSIPVLAIGGFMLLTFISLLTTWLILRKKYDEDEDKDEDEDDQIDYLYDYTSW